MRCIDKQCCAKESVQGRLSHKIYILHMVLYIMTVNLRTKSEVGRMREVGSMWASDIASICSFMFLLQSSNGQCGCVPSFDPIRPTRKGLPISTLMEHFVFPLVGNRLISTGLHCECHGIDGILQVYWVGCDPGRFTCKEIAIIMVHYMT